MLSAIIAAVFASAVPMASAAPTAPDVDGLLVTARVADPADAWVVLTNRAGEPCQVADTSLGTVALTRVEQGGVNVEPILVDVSFVQALDWYLAAQLVVLAPGESLEVPLETTPLEPTGLALHSVMWSQNFAPIGSLYPVTPDEPLRIEFTYATPDVVATDGPPLCAPAAGATAPEGRAGAWWPLALVAVGVSLVLLAVLLVVLRRRAGRHRSGGGAPSAVPAVVVAGLLTTGLVALDWSAAAAPAHADFLVHEDLAGPWAECMDIIKAPGGDPAGIMPTLEREESLLRVTRTYQLSYYLKRWVSPDKEVDQDKHIVFWNPDSLQFLSQNVVEHPCTTLYHELYHAYEGHLGVLDNSECVTAAGPSGINIGEVNATRAENLLRVVLGLPEREVYGHARLPSGECLLPTERPAPAEPPQCSGSGCGSSVGDPHLVTFDGTRYSFQAVGEFVAAVDPGQGFQVQVRQEPIPGSRLASINTAMAFDVAGDQVEVRTGDQAPQLLVDGELRAEAELSLPAGGVVRRVVDGWRHEVSVSWPDGSRAVVQRSGGWLDLSLEPAGARSGRLAGLLGDFDGDPANDLRPRGGDPLPLPATYEALYREFADSWRVDEASSLFTYVAGTGPQTYVDRTFPDRHVTVDELPNRAWAEQICHRAGVSEPGALAACTLDVGLTGQPDFAASARTAETFLGRPDGHPAGAGTLLTVERPGGTAEFTFPAVAGEKVYLWVGWTDLPAHCSLRVLGPDGQPLTPPEGRVDVGFGCVAQTDLGPAGFQTANDFAPVVLPESGEYTVRLGPVDSAGQARVWVVRPRDQEEPITIDGLPVTAVIGQYGAESRFSFIGRQGQRVILEASDVTLPEYGTMCGYGPDDRYLGCASFHDRRAYLDLGQLPQTGGYTVVVSIDVRYPGVGQAIVRLVSG